MDTLFDIGLFSELEGVAGCDPVFYEDVQKQHAFTTSSPVNLYGDCVKDPFAAADNLNGSCILHQGNCVHVLSERLGLLHCTCTLYEVDT